MAYIQHHTDTTVASASTGNYCSGWFLRHSHTFRSWLLGALAVLFLFIGRPNYVLAQSETGEIPAQSPELRIASLEQRYDSQVMNILSNYFDRRKFFVDVNINAEMVEETYTVTQNNVQQSTPDVTMPGLPFLPEENMRSNQVGQSPESSVTENTVRRLQLRNITVNIYADSSLTSDDLEFMRLIAGIAAKINEARGDVINITQTNIPNLSGTPTAAPADTSQASTGTSGSIALLYEYIPWFVLLIVSIIAGVAYLYRKPLETDNNFRQQRMRYRSNTSRQEAASQSTVADSREGLGALDEDEGNSELEKLTDKFFTKPNEVKLLFESWIEENPEEGVTKAAKVVNTVDKRLIRSIKNELDSEFYAAIKNAAEDLPAPTEEQKQEIAGKFNSEFNASNSRLTSGKKRDQLPLLKVLEHFPDDRIYELIQGENTRTAAFLLDYLSEEQAAHILDKVSDDLATNIMMHMMRIRDLPYKQQKEIASKLFEKAMNLQDTKSEYRYDSDRILSLLESLPMRKQRQQIEKLKAADPQLGKFIESQFITIEQIPELDKELLKEAISPINTETLLDAVIGLPQSITDKLLSVRPKREQRLIRMELKQISNEDERDTDYAKSMLMDAIRKTARQYNK